MPQPLVNLPTNNGNPLVTRTATHRDVPAFLNLKVNLQIEQSTANELNRVVEASNMVRDAFINRLIMFLRSSTTLLKALELPEFITRREFDSSVPDMPTSPLRAIETVHDDPLFYIRTAIEERHKTDLYLTNLPKDLIGFSCYLDDADVPGTSAYQKTQEQFEML